MSRGMVTVRIHACIGQRRRVTTVLKIREKSGNLRKKGKSDTKVMVRLFESGSFTISQAHVHVIQEVREKSGEMKLRKVVTL